jgi:hypothetical protein
MRLTISLLKLFTIPMPEHYKLKYGRPYNSLYIDPTGSFYFIKVIV